ncbi:hypothetical protein [Levilactobacillus acidifarinae]|uniref:Uncharacterized protein n=1 Tax=Levilactobacillus acidifarinae DSM 19394 = JCM 15949 TaxID=1423715 RepID=A0A0R1LJ93_9LACO|nr:hypothetical protein [Levilactobacillus acidifarinae]KRK95680.1 hypothetical protein FD25_GL000095 [Levilactobacillus acidifarinae DSM 19394]GEO69416.1 hypothetical protein LAC03_13260 [Levilactobacillus acidifarinae]
MATFQESFRVLWRPKLHRANRLVGLYFIAVVVSLGVQVWLDGLAELDFPGTFLVFTGIWGLVVLIDLARRGNQELVSMTYRLMPVREWQLYLASLASSFVTYGYVLAVGLGMTLISFNWPWLPQWEHAEIRRWLFLNSGLQDHSTASLYLTAGYLVAMLLLVTLWVWAAVILVQFIVTTISAFLPNFQQKLVKIGLAILLVYAGIMVVRWGMDVQASVVGSVSDTAQDWISLMVPVFWTVVMSGMNVYLMRHWVEARA